MDIVQFIIEDLKKAKIENYSLEHKHLNSAFAFNSIIEATNSIIYVYYSATGAKSGFLESYDNKQTFALSTSNESIIKFLNDVTIFQVTELKYIKVRTS
ncbi:MAG: hypothetical protein JXR68_14185 [Bacteroidales bacterium]|nr:hypothetical protein [Bacteroidales bacterium]